MCPCIPERHSAPVSYWDEKSGPVSHKIEPTPLMRECGAYTDFCVTGNSGDVNRGKGDSPGVCMAGGGRISEEPFARRGGDGGSCRENAIHSWKSPPTTSAVPPFAALPPGKRFRSARRANALILQ
jgi:hypothetical protein